LPTHDLFHQLKTESLRSRLTSYESDHHFVRNPARALLPSITR
jgi:hypothetical protein